MTARQTGMYGVRYPVGATATFANASTNSPPHANSLTIQTSASTPIGLTAVGIALNYNSPLCRQSELNAANVIIDVETPSPTPSPSPSPTPTCSQSGAISPRPAGRGRHPDIDGACPAPSPSPSPPAGLNQGCGDQSKTAGSAIAAAVNANPGILNEPTGNSNGQELYGYIYENSTGTYFYMAGNNGKPVNLNAKGSVSIAPPNPPNGYTYVGWYHTHPFDPNAAGGIVTDANNGLFFSPLDLSSSAPGGSAYVAVQTATITGGPVFNQWFSYVNGKQSAGKHVGDGGC